VVGQTEKLGIAALSWVLLLSLLVLEILRLGCAMIDWFAFIAY
jgi:hypothetical protein